MNELFSKTFKNGVKKIKPSMDLFKLRKGEGIKPAKHIHYQINLRYAETEMNKNIVSKLTLLTENKYRPSEYLEHNFSQSLYNVRYSRTLRVNYHRELVVLEDGGQISLDWALPIDPVTDLEYQPAKDGKILFIIHGLTGGSNMNYIKALILHGQKNGYRCVAFNSKGINTELITPETYSGESLDDMDFALKLVKNRYPEAPLFGVGASYGSNMLLRWAGNLKENNFLTAMAGLATPYKIMECVDKMGYIYEGFLVDRYKANCINPHKEMLSKLKDSHDICLKRLARTVKITDFHKEITVKLFGYESVDEYFRLSNVQTEQILNIQKPCLLMHSRDDPIVTFDCVPLETLHSNPHIIHADTSHGAHVCWYAGNPPQRWYPKPVIQYFEAILAEEQKKTKSTESS